MDFIAVIPARFASTRFPGKPLADLMGRPVIQHVVERVKKVVPRVVVATDDSRIFDVVKVFGAEAVMTSSNHRSGTDRIREACDILDVKDDVVINVQGDEPFVDPSMIQSLVNCFDDPKVPIATLVRPFPHDGSFLQLSDPNRPKVVLDNNMNARWFSRSVIPFTRGVPYEQWPETTSYYLHIGLYAYRLETLRLISSLKPTPAEKAESLEQLRWLENGLQIRVALTDKETFGIDTPEDLQAAISHIKSLQFDV